MVLNSCKSTPVKNDKVIFPDISSFVNEDGVPYISYEYYEKDGSISRSNDFTKRGVVVTDIIVPKWLWTEIEVFLIDNEAAKERLKIIGGQE